jgi:hypothetical protein
LRGWKPRQVDRLCGARGKPYHRVSAVALTNHDQSVCMAHLIDYRCTHRPGGKNAAIANTAAGIDHQKRLIENQPGALETIIHDDEIDALADQQFGAPPPCR